MCAHFQAPSLRRNKIVRRAVVRLYNSRRGREYCLTEFRVSLMNLTKRYMNVARALRAYEVNGKTNLTTTQRKMRNKNYCIRTKQDVNARDDPSCDGKGHVRAAATVCASVSASVCVFAPSSGDTTQKLGLTGTTDIYLSFVVAHYICSVLRALCSVTLRSARSRWKAHICI